MIYVVQVEFAFQQDGQSESFHQSHHDLDIRYNESFLSHGIFLARGIFVSCERANRQNSFGGATEVPRLQ
jgi:hypothetical protein